MVLTIILVFGVLKLSAVDTEFCGFTSRSVKRSRNRKGSVLSKVG